MASKPPELISGWKTTDDWCTAKSQLVLGGDPKLWQQTFHEFFRTRLELRYLHPIEILQQHGTFTGEGFSIAAIQCSLLEFLESTLQGINYRYTRDPSTLGPHEYSSSSSVFTSFLINRQPFGSVFTPTTASDFYASVRCGLLHEARTKNGWRIHACDASARLVDVTNKIMFRDHFQTGLLTFIDQYERDLLERKSYQEAFIRKFDDLSKPAA